MASRPPPFNTTARIGTPESPIDPLAILGREEMLRNIMWTGGGAEMAADTRQSAGIEGTNRRGRQYDVRGIGMDAYTPAAQANFRTFSDAPINVLRGSQSDETGFLFGLPGQQYALFDGDELIGRASNPEQAQALVQRANELSANAGKKGNIQMLAQNNEGGWTTMWHNAPDKSGFGQFMDLLLPIAASFLIPGSGALAAGAKAAGGSALSSVLQGRSLEDTLLRAGLSGVTAGALDGIGGALGGKASSTVGGISQGLRDAAVTPLTTGATAGLGQIAAPVLGGAVDPIINVVASGLGGAAGSLGGLAGGLGGSLAGGALTPTPDSPEITVTGTTPPPIDAGLAGLPSEFLNPIASNNPTQPVDGGEADMIDVEVDGVGTISVPAEMVAAAGGTAALGAILAAQNAGGVSGGVAANTGNAGVGTGAAAAGGGLGIGQIAQGALGGLSVLQGIAGLLGGGGGNAGAGIGGNPNPGIVTYQPLNRQQNAINFDPFTYGQTGGEFKFFNDAQPQFQINQRAGIGGGTGQLPPPTTSGPPAAYVPPTQNFKRGGFVRGIGGGQDDLIDARLSDGEYVIDAQTVADLGDGSNDAGARRLDEMRQMIRKQAGRRNTKTIAPPQKGVKSLLRAMK